MGKKNDKNGIEEARKCYNDCVNHNILNNLSDKEYRDPDQQFIVKVKPIICIEGESEIEIKMSTDGVCGKNKIKSLALDDKIAKYKLIREYMFDCLYWPCHAMGINQKRGFKSVLDDRLDRTLIDIQDFYSIIQGRKYSVELLNEIAYKCKLSDAYLNANTFVWLCSFKNFNDFIVKRRLQAFVEWDEKSNSGKAESWTRGEEFTEDYFNVLCERIQNYKKISNLGLNG